MGRFFFSEKPFFLGLKFEWNLSVNTERSGSDYCWLYCDSSHQEKKMKLQELYSASSLFVLIIQFDLMGRFNQSIYSSIYIILLQTIKSRLDQTVQENTRNEPKIDFNCCSS